MPTLQAETIARADNRQWPRVKWNHRDLQWTAEALQVMNPNGFQDADSLASYIRSLSETELFKHQAPLDVSTGGWTVSFFRAWDTCADQFDFCAVVTVSAYTAHRYAMATGAGPKLPGEV